jgi:hypothetical protein
MAMHVACGLPTWHGDAINAPTDTSVIYIAAEGSFGLRNRILAWLKKHNQEFSDRLVVVEKAVRFMESTDIDKLIRTVSSATTMRPVMIVVDTVSRAIPGAEENAAKEMSVFVEACDRLKDVFKCVVLGIHHAGKDGSMRGSTALGGAGDFIFQLDRKEGTTVGRLRCEKQKDAPDGWSEPYRFDLVSLDEGQSSLVPERCEQSIGPDRTLTPMLADEVLAAMEKAWASSEPWGATYHSGERRASAVMVRDFNFSAEKAEALLELWTNAGDVAVELRDKKTRLKGYRVLRDINSNRAPEESIFG